MRKKYKIRDFGCFSSESVDYPDYAKKVAKVVVNGKDDRGILICGTGVGMSMAANKFSGVRAAVCWNKKVAKLSRKHNDANVLCLGARMLSDKKAFGITDIWLKTDFEAGRHIKRVKKINKMC